MESHGDTVATRNVSLSILSAGTRARITEFSWPDGYYQSWTMNGIEVLHLSKLHGVLTEEVAGDDCISNWVRFTFSVGCRLQRIVDNHDTFFSIPVAVGFLSAKQTEIFRASLNQLDIHCRPNPSYQYDSGPTRLVQVEYDNIHYLSHIFPGTFSGAGFCG